jgi:hypothetical protein
VSAAGLQRLPLEHFREPRDDAIVDSGPTDGHAQTGEGCHSPVGNTARDNQAEIVQIGGDIHCEPMTGDPA